MIIVFIESINTLVSIDKEHKKCVHWSSQTLRKLYKFLSLKITGKHTITILLNVFPIQQFIITLFSFLKSHCVRVRSKNVKVSCVNYVSNHFEKNFFFKNNY